MTAFDVALPDTPERFAALLCRDGKPLENAALAIVRGPGPLPLPSRLCRPGDDGLRGRLGLVLFHDLGVRGAGGLLSMVAAHEGRFRIVLLGLRREEREGIADAAAMWGLRVLEGARIDAEAGRGDTDALGLDLSAHERLALAARAAA